MRLHDPHLTDRDLLMELDEELSASRKAAVERHLCECGACRARRAAIEEAAAMASDAYLTRRAPSSADVVDARVRLKRRLHEVAEPAERPWLFGSRASVLTFRHVLAGAAAIVVAAFVVLPMFAGRPGVSRPVPPVSQYPLPIASMTPGATWDVTADELCAGIRHTRPVSLEMRSQVVGAYGMAHVPEEAYELDYLVTPELGGATDSRNLWPQLYGSPTWNARVKDELERLLPELVCAGELDLETAQRDIAVDWIAAYKKYFDTDEPLQAHRGPELEDDDDDDMYVLADARPVPAVRLVSLTSVR